MVKFNKSVFDNIKSEVRQELSKQTYDVDTEAKRLILETEKTGRLYSRQGGRVHQASAPGEPFANDTGNALAQIRVYFPNDFEGRVNFGAEYAPYLEFGTEKMAPRPVARPALENKRKDIEKGLSEAVQRGINKSGKPSS